MSPSTVPPGVKAGSGQRADAGVRLRDRLERSVSSSLWMGPECHLAEDCGVGDSTFLARLVRDASDLPSGHAALRGSCRDTAAGPGRQRTWMSGCSPSGGSGTASRSPWGSTVTHDVPDASVAYGTPAVVHGSLGRGADAQQRVLRVAGYASRYGVAGKTS